MVDAVRAVAPEVKIGIQLAHAGRKGSTYAPWMPGMARWGGAKCGGADNLPQKGGHSVTVPLGQEDEQGSGCKGFRTIAPSPLSYDEGVRLAVPEEMTLADIQRVRDAFAAAAVRSHEAGR